MLAERYEWYQALREENIQYEENQKKKRKVVIQFKVEEKEEEKEEVKIKQEDEKDEEVKKEAKKDVKIKQEDEEVKEEVEEAIVLDMWGRRVEDFDESSTGSEYDFPEPVDMNPFLKNN